MERRAKGGGRSGWILKISLSWVVAARVRLGGDYGSDGTLSGPCGRRLVKYGTRLFTMPLLMFWCRWGNTERFIHKLPIRAFSCNTWYKRRWASPSDKMLWWILNSLWFTVRVTSVFPHFFFFFWMPVHENALSCLIPFLNAEYSWTLPVILNMLLQQTRLRNTRGKARGNIWA